MNCSNPLALTEIYECSYRLTAIATGAYFQNKIERRPCPDQSWGRLDLTSSDNWGPLKKCIGNKTKNLKRIVVILESPHTDEYMCTDSPQPANGKTGKSIQKGLRCVINNYKDSKWVPDEKYEIIIMNAIQYQLSLGSSTQKYRDQMFIRMWAHEAVRNNFIARLTKYQPDIIINCCTNGERFIDEKEKKTRKMSLKYAASVLNIEKKSLCDHGFTGTRLKDFVWNAVKTCTFENPVNPLFFECQHPASWGRKTKNGVIELELTKWRPIGVTSKL